MAAQYLDRVPGQVLKIIPVIVLFITIVVFSSCEYNSEEELAEPQDSCQTADVTFTLSVVPVVEAHCYSCHSISAATAGVVLEGYGNLIAYVNNGKLLPAIDHTGPSPMPPGGTLAHCTVEQITAWVDKGAPND